MYVGCSCRDTPPHPSLCDPVNASSRASDHHTALSEVAADMSWNSVIGLPPSTIQSLPAHVVIRISLAEQHLTLAATFEVCWLSPW